ncbi:MAG: hypothetical protein AABX34_02675 [Nanoarchaeota archaeon]
MSIGDIHQQVDRILIELQGPQIGMDIYLPTELHVYNGANDFQGGLCRIVNITEEYGFTGVGVFERLGKVYNWDYLLKNQEKWEQQYGDRRGFPDPDLRPEFNNDSEAEWK